MPELANLNGHGTGAVQLISRRLPQGTVIEIRGEIDLSTARTVELEVRRAEESHDVVVLDLSKTSFMDSTGLYVIIAANARLRDRGGRLLVVHGAPQIQRLMQVTCVADHLELVEDAAELERVTEVRDATACLS